MLINLTSNIEEIKRREKMAKESNFVYIPQSDPEWLVETGIYRTSFPFNFSYEEFMEKLDGFNYNEKLYNTNKKEGETHLQYYSRTSKKNWVSQYGVADNIEQIKEFYKRQIKDKTNKFIITLSPVHQIKENKGKGGGWRWHKWGEYIGKLNPQCEYLDDEEFGNDFQYVICFQLYAVY